MSRLHVCVDVIALPFGNIIFIGCVADRMFTAADPLTRKWPVAPESEMAYFTAVDTSDLSKMVVAIGIYCKLFACTRVFHPIVPSVRPCGHGYWRWYADRHDQSHVRNTDLKLWGDVRVIGGVFSSVMEKYCSHNKSSSSVHSSVFVVASFDCCLIALFDMARASSSEGSSSSKAAK